MDRPFLSLQVYFEGIHIPTVDSPRSMLFSLLYHIRIASQQLLNLGPSPATEQQ